MSTDHDLEAVRAGELICVELAVILAERHDGYEVLVTVVVCELRTDFLRARLARQKPVLEHDGRRHALIIIVHDRHEDRRIREPRHRLHFRKVLVLQVEAIDAWCVQQLRPCLRLVLRDHFLAAPGVAGQAVAAHRVVLRNHAHRHQRCRCRNEAGRMTAWVRYTLTRANHLPLRL